MPDSNAVWVYSWYDGNCAPTSFCGDIFYTVYGDTLLGNYSYKKIYMSSNGLPFAFIAGIRQDTVEKKVYLIQNGNCTSNDTLLYDYDLGVGDTLNQCNEIVGGETTYVTACDSLLISGTWRKRIHLNINSYLIEGIGSTGGLLGNWNGWIGGYYSLKCFSLNGVTIFPDTICNTYPGTNINDTGFEPDILVQPNPIKEIGYINIRLQNPSNIKLQFFDLYGKKNILLNTELNAGLNTIELNVSHFKSGIYNLQIINETETYHVNKLIEIIH